MRLKPWFRRRAFLEYVAAQRWYEKQRAGLGEEFESEIERALYRACEAAFKLVGEGMGVGRVIARLGDSVVRQTVTEVAERLVRQEIERIKLHAGR